MNTVYLILGTNKGDRAENLHKACGLLLEKAGAIPQKSDVFVTAPWGNPDQPDFYNQAIVLKTELSADELMQMIIKLELEMGRIRTDEKWVERIIDIDILFYNSDVIHHDHLTIPHPYIQERKFVLLPLSQIAKDLVHPKLKKNVEQLLIECEDELPATQLKHPNT